MNASDPNLELTADEVMQMPDFELCDHVWQIVTDSYYNQNPSWADEEPKFNVPESFFATKLSPHWAAAYAIHTFEYDYLGGGLSKFFFSQRGLLNLTLPKAFESVGASEFVEPFNEATTVFNSFSATLFNREWESGPEQFSAEDTKFTQALSATDKKIWELIQVQDPRTLLATYIRANCRQYQTRTRPLT